MIKDTGGTAFPSVVYSSNERVKTSNGDMAAFGSRSCDGMTLRDYFAAQVLPAVIAAYIEANGRCIGTDHISQNPPAIAYKIADGMIAERAK